MPVARLDAGAESCGRLIELIAEAARDLTPGSRLVVVAYDFSSQFEVPAWCRLTGHALVTMLAVGDHLEFEIEKHQEGGGNDGAGSH